MPKLAKNKLPAYRHHKARGLAVVTLNGKDVYLGPHGTQASKTEYDRVIAEWVANGRRLSMMDEDQTRDITISELIVAYWRHAQEYYVKGGKPTSEQALIRLAMRPLRRLYGTALVSEFGPLALKAVRQAMIQLQRLTGMRPGEVVIMRTADIDTTGSVWHYLPASHKTEHHGHGGHGRRPSTGECPRRVSCDQ